MNRQGLKKKLNPSPWLLKNRHEDELPNRDNELDPPDPEIDIPQQLEEKAKNTLETIYRMCGIVAMSVAVAVAGYSKYSRFVFSLILISIVAFNLILFFRCRHFRPSLGALMLLFATILCFAIPVCLHILKTLKSDADGVYYKGMIQNGMGLLICAFCIGLFVVSFCVMNDERDTDSSTSETSDKNRDSMFD